MHSPSLAERSRHLDRTLNGLFWAFTAAFGIAGALYLRDYALPTVLVLFSFYTLYNLRKPMVVGFLGTTVGNSKLEIADLGLASVVVRSFVVFGHAIQSALSLGK